MNANNELLNFIYQNSEMGVTTLKELMDICKDEEFKKVLAAHHSMYEDINKKAISLIKSQSKEPKEINALSTATTYIMIKVNTLMDKSPSHMAEMMMQGSTMGIIDMRKRLNEYEGEVEENLLSLAKELLNNEEKNVEELKKYL